MGRRQAIEQKDLFEAADRLTAEGKEVTALTLLDVLGGGSFRTIYKYLELWQKARPVLLAADADEIPPQVQASFAASWRLAQHESRRQVQEVREKAKEEIAAAVHQFEEALEVIEKLEQEREAEAEATEALHKIIAEMKVEASKLESELAAEKARNEELREQLKASQTERDAAIKAAA
jgi:flagellar biosynthesis GTPase FlhF